MAVEHALKIQQKILALLVCSYGSHRDNHSASLLLYVISLGGHCDCTEFAQCELEFNRQRGGTSKRGVALGHLFLGKQIPLFCSLLLYLGL